MKEKNIVILIPAYNPTKDLISLTDELIKNKFTVVVVNDGSNNQAKKIFKKLNKNVILLKHKENMGKGQALKTGFKYILENIKCQGVITADADGQHLFCDIVNIADYMNNDLSSVVLGIRLQNKEMLLKSRLGNSITRMVFKVATGKKVYDTQTGLRGIPFKYLQDFINIEGQRYEYEINMLLYCARNNIDFKEIKIHTVYIDNNKASSFNTVKDSFKIYKCILKNSDLLIGILFIISAIISFILDFLFVIAFNKLTSSVPNRDLALLIDVVLARIISSAFNFTFNRNIVFKNKSNIFKSLLQYYILATFTLLLNYTFLDILTVRLFSFDLVISKVFVEILLFIVNYIIQKFIIFKNNTLKS